ncbi:MAG: sn-glycerol-3-phosphate ABC transporter ATP-binding protein UgpC [Peptoniphilaceae bacterium]|nr:sn-glycerol-3-phosphate ABC transporter ATP-binding protein UgpC [Peptoniphilaceae bacterium]MDY6019012.1 sn-glycerol-3-phosphate ABC transporter ATP-binding protein UgpC [Anaerococcus sp.]
MSNLKFENIHKIYDNGYEAVHDFNLEISDNEFIVFVGPSGCGKSTTLRMIAGLEDITSGTISIDGKIINDVSPKDRDIAMVFQNYALYPHMTVYNNMAYALKNNKADKKTIAEKIKKASELLQIEEYLDRKPKQLSGGQKQRVALGRAIVRNPKVFLMDEPLSNLDAKLRAEMRAQINKLHKSLQTTFIYVTHDQTEAMTLGDRIVIMKDGIIQQVDTPYEVYHNPINTFVAGFIGSPQINFINLPLEKKDKQIIGHLIDQEFICTNDKLKDYNEVLMGVRPEDIHFEKTENSICLTAKINIIENLGDHQLAYMDLAGKEIIVTDYKKTYLQIDETRKIYIDKSNLLFFDKESTFNINSK